MNAEELASRLRMLCQICGFDIECARRVSLLHRDINAANPGVVHTNVGDYVSAFVSHRDVHWLPNFPGFFFSAALITRRASSSFTADIDSSLQLFKRVVRRPEVRELVQQVTMRPDLIR